MANPAPACPYCCRKRRQPEFGGREQEIDYIQKEIGRLDQLSSRIATRIREDQAVLRRRLEMLRPQDPCLPPQILSLVLHFAFPSQPFKALHDFPDLQHTTGLTAAEGGNRSPETQDPIREEARFPFTISAVSFAFRKLTLGISLLWTSIGLRITPSSVKPSAMLLGLFLDRSAGLPLTVAIHYSFEILTTHRSLIHANIDSRLIENFGRIKHLHLIHPPQIWHKYLPRLIYLEECSINLTRPDFLGSCEQVKISNDSLLRLSLHGALQHYDAQLQLSWSTLTSLKLSKTSLEIVVQALIRCRSSLVEFYCRSPVLKRRKAGIGRLVLEHLEIFDWESGPDGICSWALLKVLRVPVLKVLRWHVPNYHPRDAEVTMFNRLPSTLMKVEVDFKTYESAVRRGIDENIEDLSLHSCSAADLWVLLQDLTPRSRGQGLTKKMPSLKRLTILGGVLNDGQDGRKYYERLEESYASGIVEMLEGRREQVGGSFTLELESSRIKWPTRVKTRLRDIRAGGFELAIREHGREARWMRNTT